MSIESLFFMAALAGAYKLGSFNATNPGEAWKRVDLSWKWLCDWLKK